MAGKSVANVVQHGGSIVVAVPQFILRQAGIKKGNQVGVWTPQRGVVVLEKSIEQREGKSKLALMEDIYLGADAMITEMRDGGRGKIDLTEAECAMCKRNVGGVTYQWMHLCLACETRVGFMGAAEQKKIFTPNITKEV